VVRGLDEQCLLLALGGSWALAAAMAAAATW
jgi:hypothetical protein